MRKKEWVGLFVLFLVLVVLWSSVAFSQKLELWTFVDTHARWFREMAEKFSKEIDPQFSLDVKVFEYGAMHDKLLVALQTGIGAPDLADVEQGRFGGFLIGEIGFVDLTPRLKEGNYLEDIVESRLSLYAKDGKYYGVEHALCPVVLYYRQDLFEEAGINPEEIVTWDDFIKAGQKLTKEDRFMVSLDNDAHEGAYLTILIRQRGGDWFDEAGNIQADSPLIIDTLKWLLDLRGVYHIAEDPPIGPAFFGALKEGRYATVIGADWYAGFMKDYCPELSGRWRVAPLPVWPDDPVKRRTSCFGGTGLTITRFCKDVDKAWEFVKFTMLSPEANVRRYELTNLWPPLRSAWQDERLYKPDPYFGNQVVGRVFAEVGTESPVQHQSPYLYLIHSTLWPQKYWPRVLEGEISPEEALSSVAEEIRKEQGRR
ncbi:MAG: sugar ABC transporter substrate-binding protein [Nitrososphaeria archaeon]|nr:sugar ABC transporter substrate-binding protein [Nitrososphaeria archaeon]